MTLRSYCAVAICFFGVSYAQENKGSKSSDDDSVQKKTAGTAFDFRNSKDVRLLIGLREIAIKDLVNQLEQKAGKKGEADDFSLFAAEKLGELRADDPDTLKVLCKNVMLRDIVVNHNSPLDGLAAARALVRIGSPKVATVIFEELRGAQKPAALLAFAAVLNSLDGAEVTCLRVKRAIEQETKHPRFPSGVDQDYVQNLKQIEEWLSQPKFFDNVDNWPSQR